MNDVIKLSHFLLLSLIIIMGMFAITCGVMFIEKRQRREIDWNAITRKWYFALYST
jgi:hypothetical protein